MGLMAAYEQRKFSRSNFFVVTCYKWRSYLKGTEYVKFVIRKWEGGGEGVDISVTILTADNGVDKNWNLILIKNLI